MCVLLVEDEPLIMEIMSESLRDSGYEVVEAADGPQAIAALAGLPGRIVVLVSDFHMPGGMDGAQLASKFRQASPGVPIVIATGRPDIAKRSMGDGFGYTLLCKPYRPSELAALVRKLVGPPVAST